MSCELLGIELPKKLTQDLYLGNVLPQAYSLLLASIAKQYDGLLVVLVENFNVAYQLEEELNSITSTKILHFPDWETLPYDHFSPHAEIISDRLATLYNLPMLASGILIVPMVTIMHKLCPVDYISQNVLLVKTQDTLILDNFRANLEQAGYIRVPQVMNYGEFAIRGSIIDVFPIGANLPYRIDLFGEQVDSIRTFNIDTQRTIAVITEINILPAQEYPFDKDAIATFRTNWRQQFTMDPKNTQVYQDVSKGFKTPGLEYYLPLFFSQTASLFDYLPKNCLLVRTKDCFAAAEDFFNQVTTRHDQFCHDSQRPILPVKQLFFNPTEVFSILKQFNQIICSSELEKNQQNNLAIEQLPEDTVEMMKQDSGQYRKLFCVESKGRKEIFSQTILKYNSAIQLSDVEQIVDFCQPQIKSSNLHGMTINKLSNGFILSKSDMVIICEDDLLSNKIKTTTQKSTSRVDPNLSIRNLIELDIGDPIVHVDHGVGRYLGLTQLQYSATLGEFLIIEYAQQNKLYVPITNLNLVHRYSGADLEHAPLHSLGADKWQKEKQKASRQIKDTAANLLEIYANRANKKGIKYKLNEDNYQKFIDQFPYAETADQLKSNTDIIEDLTRVQPMDRVICGDVGFGKTEIAMRAAFIVADNAKQVAILAPTTLLAKQHYQTLLDRFADFPFNIQLLSRFVDSSQQREIIQQLAAGSCDIIIGTHRLLQKDLKFKSLGLLIIDEEHKFGVEQKEQFKKMRSNVEILSLTATPIPRTLNMAMSGIRDISIIATPPNHRLAVKTFVREHNKDIIKEAVMRELQRGGQVYYLHNKVTSIDKVAADLQALIPQATVKVAHGQMDKKQLERVMVEFYHRKFNVLVCTTIIENGIDIPTANTIIIDRADCFGLSQLHQLRGRVGRSHHQAYAFCFINNKKLLTKDSVKRLEALESLDTLGIGFTLATHDLEIRGSGELLGSEQSGNMQTIGFNLYMELLEHAISYLKQHKSLDNLEDSIVPVQVEIDLQLPALIPSDYIPDIATRLALYKKISKARTEHRLNDLIAEFIDRFGELPDALSNLFAITKLKIICQQLNIIKIKLIKQGFSIEFSATQSTTQLDNSNTNRKIDINKIINLLQKYPNKYKLISNNKLTYYENSTEQDRVEVVSKLLASVAIC
jgi:transcription-repair coupling factor (superfamily II helicase)